MHSALVDAYMADSKAQDLASLPDDGYILQTLGHHLTWARRLDDLKQLLSNPDWLEAKLHGYGTINVVADFRRCMPVLMSMQSLWLQCWQAFAQAFDHAASRPAAAWLCRSAFWCTSLLCPITCLHAVPFQD